MRRGFASGPSGDDDVAARENTGSIESSSGSESTMPAPRRNWRRDTARRVATKEPGCCGVTDGFFMGRRLFVEEEITPDDLANQAAHAVVAGARVLENFLDRRAVAETHR